MATTQPRWTAAALLLATTAVGAQQPTADDLAAGKLLFTKTAVPACALCHTLRDAGATGEIGPVLDELKPDAARVEKAIRSGLGQMPAYTTLSDAQIALLSRYVSAVAK